MTEYLDYALQVRVDFHKDCTYEDEIDVGKNVNSDLKKVIKEAITNYFIHKISDSEYVTGFNIGLEER